MKINCNYKNFGSHSGIVNGNEELEFSVNELIHAAYTVGKKSWEDIQSHPYYTEKEIYFRISMIRAFLNLQSENVSRSIIFQRLDPSEKGAINYFLGNVFCKLIMQRRFRVRWLMHLDLFEGRIDLGGQSKRPDFIGKKTDSAWAAVESKSRIKKDNAETEALGQLSMLNTIDGVPPSIKLATILYGNGERNLNLDIVDPEEGEGLDIHLDNGKLDYARDYYALVYMMIKDDMEVKEINGREFATKNIYCHEVILGLDLEIFNTLSRTTEDTYVSKEIEEHLKDQYVDKDNYINVKEDYYVGPDGVYVKFTEKL